MSGENIGPHRVYGTSAIYFGTLANIVNSAKTYTRYSALKITGTTMNRLNAVATTMKIVFAKSAILPTAKINFFVGLRNFTAFLPLGSKL